MFHGRRQRFNGRIKNARLTWFWRAGKPQRRRVTCIEPVIGRSAVDGRSRSPWQIIHLEPHSAPALGCDWQLVDDCGARSISVRVLRAFHLARRSSRSSVAAPSHKNNRFFVPHLLTSAARTYERTGNVKLIIIHPMRTGWRRQQHTQTDIIESTYSQLNRTTICCYSLLLIIIVIVVIVCSSNNTASGGLLRIYNVRYSAGTCSCLCVCVYMSAATVTTTNIKHQSVVILT